MLKKLITLPAVIFIISIIFIILAFSGCLGRDNPPAEENPGVQESEASSSRPELSIPAPEGINPPGADSSSEDAQPGDETESEPEPSEPDNSENASEESSESESGADGSSGAPIGPAPLVAGHGLNIGVIDSSGATQENPREVYVTLPSGWSVEGSMLYYDGGKIGEILPCRLIADQNDPYASLDLPGAYQTVDVGGGQWLTWAADGSQWDQGSGTSATVTTRYYYKASGDAVYGMYLYLFYDGSPTVNEGTALDIFAGLGLANG